MTVPIAPDLPPLPEPWLPEDYPLLRDGGPALFTADQMRAYLSEGIAGIGNELIERNAEIADLKQALSQAAADAQRYRFMEKHGWRHSAVSNIFSISPGYWDRAVDDAMALDAARANESIASSEKK